MTEQKQGIKEYCNFGGTDEQTCYTHVAKHSLVAIPSYAVESRETADVEQFGVVFNEVVIADADDDLDDPRDLEFHPEERTSCGSQIGLQTA